MNLATRYKQELEALKEEDDAGYWRVLRKTARDVYRIIRDPDKGVCLIYKDGSGVPVDEVALIDLRTAGMKADIEPFLPEPLRNMKVVYLDSDPKKPKDNE
jgi:hypothetical protein